MAIYTRSNPPNGYYIYAYIRSKDSKTAKAGTPYYIGKGKGKRAWVRTSKDHIKSPTDKSQIIIMEANLTELGAFALERFYIRWYGRKDLKDGILLNMTEGGEGASGHKQSDEHRRKISDARKKNWATNDELRRRMSELNKGNDRGKLRAGWVPTEETKRRMSESAKNRNKRYVNCDICGRNITLNNIGQHKRFTHHIKKEGPEPL